MSLITLADIQSARTRIAGAAVLTPLVPVECRDLPYTLAMKNEAAQPVGSFKLRGAFNKLAQLSADQLRRGIITYSSGNHGYAVAWAASRLGTKAVIVVPNNMPAIKRNASAALGAEIVVVGPASSERKQRAEALAAEHGYAIVPPYDDPQIIAGQGTCALEILEQLPEVDLVLAPVGGGGLLSGIASAIKLTNPNIKVYGVEPALAADAAASFAAGKQVEWSAADTTRTLADGLRTQSLGSLNLQHILQFVDGFAAVSEEEIVAAMRIAQSSGVIVEPSGAVALAAALFHAQQFPGSKHAVAVLSGGNLDPTLRESLLA